MDSISQSLKNTQIAETFKLTRLKRSTQACRAYKIKIDSSKLNLKQQEQLKMQFVEAKWLTNHILNWSKSEGHNIWEFPREISEVQHFNKDKELQTSELQYLKSSAKQEIISQQIANIRSLSKLKNAGYKAGVLRFKSQVTTLSLKQYNVTHKIVGTRKLKIQGISGYLTVNGLQQFTNIPNIEYANAKLCQTPLGYYIALTTFVPKGQAVTINQKTPKIQTTLGIDFGCSSAFTLSTGEKLSAAIEETERLKRLQRKLSKQTKGSNNSRKTVQLIRKEHQKLFNRKNDLSNKLIQRFLSYETVVIQDEQLANWKKNGHGKAVHHNVLGLVKAKLSREANVIMLSKSAPTTKLCRSCGEKQSIKLWQRTFSCQCGVVEDRDVHAAKNMVWMYENKQFLKKEKIGVERIKSKLVEIVVKPSGFVQSVKQEADKSLACQ